MKTQNQTLEVKSGTSQRLIWNEFGNDNQIITIQMAVIQLLLQGKQLTTYTGNKLCHTVDFRKRISVLRAQDWPIKDRWEQSGKKRYKVYWLDPEYIKKLKEAYND